ncbi:flagellar basal body L-ring protein FlgH [Pseudovibrio exalbescens]|uniref:flagellar basal body L-ring protein FlgH n=1 Tax=Pseudovibrio exalbescens TaxID=197461 RepID=UPI0023665CDB|nr:flagellar basal body L-ring protein FlgH [Pseudovibrio exalbescens]MDD7909013.1 flagellar basal body L-ring protein FlgH [Pseudovibrio exalbescens]
MKKAALLLLALSLAGCNSLKNVGKEPELTPLGNGLAPNVGALPVATSMQTKTEKRAFHGLWAEGEQDFFRDPRAKQIGDVLTVTIEIDDRAELDNESERSRNSNARTSADAAFAWGSISSGSANGNIGATGSTTSKGEGAIDRSEQIDLSIAAIVTQVLPNGNLIISGQQEVRVNYEVRVLSVAGIVRPEDITGRNTIPYDKIAEARVSYGGRGRITEVQQPGWGQQVMDIISPY